MGPDRCAHHPGWASHRPHRRTAARADGIGGDYGTAPGTGRSGHWRAGRRGEREHSTAGNVAVGGQDRPETVIPAARQPDGDPATRAPGAGGAGNGPGRARPHAGSSRSPTRRAAWARPRRRSTWPPAWPCTALRVLVIDLDPQGNASTALDVDHRAGTASIYNVLVEGQPLVGRRAAGRGHPAALLRARHDRPGRRGDRACAAGGQGIAADPGARWASTRPASTTSSSTARRRSAC